MRVLLTTDTIGGVWTFTCELSTALLDRAHEVALVSLGRLPAPSQEAWVLSMRHRWGEESFCFYASGCALEWMDANQNAYADGRSLLDRVVQSFQPDLFHSSQFCWGALSVPVPKIITAHSDVLSWAAACRPMGLEASCWLDRYRRLVQDGLQQADAVVAPTQWMLEALCTNFPVPALAQVILNGCSLPETQPTLIVRGLRAISAGRLWDEAKNLRLLGEIMSPLPIHLAGESRTAEAPNITYLGYLDQASLLQAFRGASVYLCPSVYEPFGLAPLEAALCGCAVVANDIASLGEVWGDAALYFKGPRQLEDTLARLVSSPGILADAQRRSGVRARQLTASSMAESYLALYQILCAKTPAYA